MLKAQQNAITVEADDLRVTTDFHLLPFTKLPNLESLADRAANDDDPNQRKWATAMLALARAGNLPTACPQEIQLLQFNPELRAVFLGGEVLTEIGLHIKQILQPATTLVAAYSNGLIAYVPGSKTYDLGGYEVEDSYIYFLRPAPFIKDVEERIVTKTGELVEKLDFPS